MVKSFSFIPELNASSYLDFLSDNWKLHLKKRTAKAPTVISLFCGCGGSSLGYSMAGYKELAAVDFEQNAIDTFKLNFSPKIKTFCADIKEIKASDFEIDKYELDILDGSPPCQGFSIAGKRDFDDERNYLFLEYTRLLKELMPKVFVMENVSGLVKDKMQVHFDQIRKSLKECGYEVRVKLLNAKFFDVPQARERLIFIGVREDLNIGPTHPKNNPIKYGVVKVDSVKTKLYDSWASCKIIKENSICHTVLTARLATHFWDKENAFGIDSYKIACSFPKEFKLISNFQEQKARLGNSVPPLMMKNIADHINKTLRRINGNQ